MGTASRSSNDHRPHVTVAFIISLIIFLLLPLTSVGIIKLFFPTYASVIYSCFFFFFLSFNDLGSFIFNFQVKRVMNMRVCLKRKWCWDQSHLLASTSARVAGLVWPLLLCLLTRIFLKHRLILMEMMIVIICFRGNADVGISSFNLDWLAASS